MTTIAKGDCIELRFTGRANGIIFDSNIAEDLKKINPEAKPTQMRIIVGQSMLVRGLDNALEGKELGENYELKLPAAEAFGQRSAGLVKTLPLHIFTQQKIIPEPGMTLALGGSLVSIRTVSGSRVIADFNNPLAGKEVTYNFTIERKIEDTKEKTEVFFIWFLRGIPEFEVNEKVVVHGPHELEPFIAHYKSLFHKLVGKELDFAFKETRKSEQKNSEPAPQQSL